MINGLFSELHRNTDTSCWLCLAYVRLQQCKPDVSRIAQGGCIREMDPVRREEYNIKAPEVQSIKVGNFLVPLYTAESKRVFVKKKAFRLFIECFKILHHMYNLSTTFYMQYKSRVLKYLLEFY
jgi:hypothetical protein